MTHEEALREALKYVAECLEKDEMYLVNSDEIVRGESIKPHLAQFARRIARDSTNWLKWCELKARA